MHIFSCRLIPSTTFGNCTQATGNQQVFPRRASAGAARPASLPRVSPDLAKPVKKKKKEKKKPFLTC